MMIQNLSKNFANLLLIFCDKLTTSASFAYAFFGISILILGLLCFIFLQLGRKLGQTEAQKETSALLKASRIDAVKRSRAVLSGQMAEQIAPFLKGFPCNPADVRFIGKPLDFIGFPGASSGNPINEILFIEVKTGSSALSKREKEIKDAVDSGRVRYIEYNPEI